jgi:hypothetical protein
MKQEYKKKICAINEKFHTDMLLAGQFESNEKMDELISTRKNDIAAAYRVYMEARKKAIAKKDISLKELLQA